MSGFPGVDVLDEFQRVPDLLSYLSRELETRNKKMRSGYPFVNL